MPNDFLNEILEHKKKILEQKKVYYEGLKKNIGPTTQTRYSLFKNAISRPGRMNLIAEIKKASPSAGLLRDRFDPVDLARIYRQCGACAVSVLTEDKYFLGKPVYLRHVSDTVNVPVLTKDFIIHEHQIFEAFCFGASAILLIVAILEQKDLQSFIATAHNLDMDALVEVHDGHELKRALEAGAQIIGINHRNLRTLEMDLTLSDRLVPLIPKDKVIVAESGIKSAGEVKHLWDLGVNAVLIGETFMRCESIPDKIQELMAQTPYGEKNES